MTNKELEALMKLCRKHGVQSLKTDAVHLVLDPNFTPQSGKPSEAPSAEPIPKPEYTEEELLTWSSTPAL